MIHQQEFNFPSASAQFSVLTVLVNLRRHKHCFDIEQLLTMFGMVSKYASWTTLVLLATKCFYIGISIFNTSTKLNVEHMLSISVLYLMTR